jgi:hypothetical protein
VITRPVVLADQASIKLQEDATLQGASLNAPPSSICTLTTDPAGVTGQLALVDNNAGTVDNLALFVPLNIPLKAGTRLYSIGGKTVIYLG